MIVRDEAEQLPRCLASVAGIVDEMVVCDTGSADGTPDVAAAHGARVVRFTWIDDFAAARNAALAAVTAEWLLVLDADERLAPDAAPMLRAVMASDALDAAWLAILDASREDATVEDVLCGRACIGNPTLTLRLFRRMPSLRWEGAVHEQTGAWLAEREGRSAAIPARIVHFGNVPERRARLGKGMRNLRLLERECETHPDRVWNYAYLASEHHFAGNPGASAAATECGWAVLRAQEAAGQPIAGASAVSLATKRVHHALREGALDRARETIEVGTRICGAHPNLSYLRGLVLEASAEGADADLTLREAGLAYLEALAARDRVYTVAVLDGATGWRARLRLGVIFLRLDEPEPAVLQLKLAGEQAPHDPEIATLLAEARARMAATPVTADPGAA